MYSAVSGFCMKRMETLELLFPGCLVASLVALSCFCASCTSFVNRAIEISVHSIELAPISNSRF